MAQSGCCNAIAGTLRVSKCRCNLSGDPASQKPYSFLQCSRVSSTGIAFWCRYGDVLARASKYGVASALGNRPKGPCHFVHGDNLQIQRSGSDYQGISKPDVTVPECETSHRRLR